jgi:hypothetical protein
VLIDDIADLLTTGGLTTTIFKGGMFGEADPTIAIIPTGGQESVHTNQAGSGLAAIERPRVQIVTRSLNPQTAMVKAQAAFKLLDGLRERQSNGTSGRGQCSRRSPWTVTKKTAFMWCSTWISTASGPHDRGGDLTAGHRPASQNAGHAVGGLNSDEPTRQARLSTSAGASDLRGDDGAHESVL